MESNPFAVFSLIVAPAILTNASSVLIMSTSNRLARGVDRARELSKQLEETTDFNGIEAQRRIRDLSATEERVLLLLGAMRSFYVALGAFSFSAIVSLFGAILVPVRLDMLVEIFEIAAMIAGMIAVSSIVYGSVLLLKETRIAVQVTTNRAASVRERVLQRQAILAEGDKHL